MTLARRIAVTSSAQIVQVAISATGLIVLARAMTAADFGLIVLLTSAVAIITVLLTAGVQSSFLVLAAQSSERPHLHAQVLVITCVVVLASAVLAPLTSALITLPVDPHLSAQVLGLTVARVAPSVYCALQTALLMGAGRIGHMSVVNIVGSAVSLAGAVGAVAMSDAPLLGAVLGLAIGTAAWAVVTAAASLTTIGFDWRLPSGAWSRLSRIGLPVHVGSIAYWLMLRADLFLLGALAPGEVLGKYAFALSVAERVSVLGAPVYAAAAERLSGTVRSIAVFTAIRLVRLHVAMALTVFLVALGFGNVILTTLGGADYDGAGLSFALLALGNAVLSVWSILALSLISQHGAAWRTATLQLFGAGLGGLLYLALIPPFGGLGAAFGSAATYVALTAAAAMAFAGGEGLRIADLIPRPSDGLDLYQASVARWRRR